MGNELKDELSALFEDLAKESEPVKFSSSQSYQINKSINEEMELFNLKFKELQNESKLDAIKLKF